MALPATPGSGGWPMLLGYSCVHVGKSLLWVGEDALTLYILVRFLALPPALAGMIFLVSALWNALCDGLIGTALHRSAWLRRWIPLLSVPAILTSALGFAALPLVAEHSAWMAAGLLLLFRTGFSLADVPHNGLTRLLAEGGQHLRAARIRAIGSSSAALIIGLVCLAMLDPGSNARSMAVMLAGGIAIAALVLMSPLPFLLVADRRIREASSVDEQTGSFGNLPLWIYCVATMLGLAGLGATGKALLHIDFVASSIGPAALLLATMGRLGAIWVWAPVARRIGNRSALGLAYAISGATALCLPWLAGGEGMSVVILLILFGAAGGGVAFLGWAVLTETIGAGHASGPAAFTAGFGVFTMSMKVALGLAAALVGGWLSASDAGVHADPATFRSLGIMIAVASGLAGAIIALSGTVKWRGSRSPVLVPGSLARMAQDGSA
ncbi:MFS transporter [Sphingomonas sp. ERG5]|uniref:MFS transporter n=1 Tax=Sphingomonas sp. ERG5 TaxID=1381597 RepID=UPI0009DFE55A|nr:MFS transporter [Sphingomonas sp. ERG5]